ncbi:differentially expressed in FDCP 6 homolog isoform X2 [Rhincodon typus]|uniref:differentially expressed in FDCP 6 homolog isoform X2 n=1 Tax=Rhincodon typus TaxID=259920 RepID=UPI00202DF244|nr:differentially expressed in FDCP 6 homolog isoform X2 [Rhincodon typus]
MELRNELLKSIWYAFTALDVEKSGKVSKSQLKVEEGAFVKETFDELCWTLTAKKNYKHDKNGNCIISEHDAFRLWCLFNFLSEDKYPLVMVPDEVEYLLKKICTEMNVEWCAGELDDFFTQEPMQQNGITVWVFLDWVNSGRFTRGIEKETVTMAVQEVYQEIIEDVLKQGYLWKKGQLRRNWTERWFILKPSILCYYVSEDRKEKKGSIALDRNCCVEILSDRDGKRCMFCVKTPSRTYEMSASDTKQRQEWTTAIQTAIRLQAEGKKSLHKDLKQKRHDQRALREKQKAAKEEELQRLKQLQEEKERKLQELELLKEAQRQAETLLKEEEQRRKQQHEEMQRALEIQLRQAEQARASMEAEMVLKEAEADRQKKRIRELEDMQKLLEEALCAEVTARQEEEAKRYAQTRLLSEEEDKMKALMQLKEEQEELIRKTQREKQELRQEMENKSKILEEAQKQLEEVRVNRQRADQDVVAAQKKLRQASSHVKHWNVQMNRLMRPIGPGDKRPTPPIVPNYRGSIGGQQEARVKLSGKTEEKGNTTADECRKENLHRSLSNCPSNANSVEEMETSALNGQVKRNSVEIRKPMQRSSSEDPEHAPTEELIR